MRVRIAAALVTLVVVTAAVLASRVHRVEQWALYTSSGPKYPLRLFLEPFPAKTYCDYDAKQVERDGGRAECRRRVSYTLDRGPSDRLVWTFISEWAALCGTPKVGS